MGLFSGNKVLKTIQNGDYKKAYSLLEREVKNRDLSIIYKHIIDSLESKADISEIAKVLIAGQTSSHTVMENLYSLQRNKNILPYLEQLANLGYGDSYIFIAKCYANKADECEDGYDKEAYETMLEWIKKADKYNRENGIDSDDVTDLIINMDVDEYIFEEKGMDMLDFFEK